MLTFCSNVGRGWVGLVVFGLFPITEFTAVCEDVFKNPSIFKTTSVKCTRVVRLSKDEQISLLLPMPQFLYDSDTSQQ